ncbi:Protein SIP5 [Yarrowia sp. B02]|nr:Protein SIP5 [Yarrowia sp. B02]
MGNVPGKEQQVRNARSISEDYHHDGHVRAKRPSVAREKKREPRVFVDPNEQVDGGYLVPQGVYTGPQDFDILVVKSLMTSRKLAPFFKGLQDYEEDWTDHQLMAAIRGFPIPAAASEPSDSSKDSAPQAISTPAHLSPPTAPPQVAISPPRHQLSSNNPFRDPLEHLSHLRIDLDNSTLSQSAPTPSWMRSGEPDQEDGDELINPGILQSPPREAPKPPASRQRAKTVTAKEPPLMVKIYRDPIECPICFLYYPNSLNMTRCCAQPICSECFVQMKRAEPHPRHDEPEPDTLLGQLDLISEPTACPYCAMSDFGVVYSPRYGPGAKQAASNGADAAAADDSAIDDSSDGIDTTNMDDVADKLMHMSGKRRSSISVTNPNVVTVDRVRPDWSKTLAAARARAARKAATANALHATAFVEGGNGEVAGSSRSSRRTRQNHEQRQAARAQELEQIMLSEAMRLSMLESQEAEEKRSEEKKRT